MNLYSVGIYIRLSREDDKNFESESITNQKSLLIQYVNENNLKLYDIYIDDGYSGTNFDRPAFKRLINDIENKKINMVITKDMSRLGRDYIGVGELVEKYFPNNNVRYIAVTDNIDTYLDSTNNDIAPFKALINDFYAKDISKKIKSSLKAKMKEGKFVGGRTPFGYDKDSNDKNHLVINEEQACIVRRIFKLSLNGLSCFKIAEILSNENVKTPASYYSFEWKSHYNLNYSEWNSKTVKDILTNRMYIGDLVQNKRNKINYKIKKVVKNNPNDYIIVEGMHEAIIEKDVFFKVQEMIPKNIIRISKKECNLLDGLLYCGDCGYRISVLPRRKKDNRRYTICNSYRTHMKDHLCTTHSNNYDNLEKEIISFLRNECKKYIDKDKIKKSFKNGINKNDKKELYKLKNEIKKTISQLDDIYMDKLNKIITIEQYNRIKKKLDSYLNTIETEYQNLIKNDLVDDKMIDNYINEILKIDNLPRELIINLIDRIEIFDDKTVNIKLCFNKKL